MIALTHLYDMVPSPELLLVLELLDPVALAGLAVAVWIRPSLVTYSILFYWLFTIKDLSKNIIFLQTHNPGWRGWFLTVFWRDTPHGVIACLGAMSEARLRALDGLSVSSKGPSRIRNKDKRKISSMIRGY